MAEALQREGFGHARVFTRFYVDREHKSIHQHFFVDTGPRTTIGKLIVTGARKVPADVVLERAGLQEGSPYSGAIKQRAEIALIDSGAYASAIVSTNADTELFIGDVPDTGGVMTDDQIDAEGNMVPRKLNPALDVTVNVVEAPNVQFRVRVGVDVDPRRIDPVAGTSLWLRNAFGPMHHLQFDVRAGYGIPLRDSFEDFSGVYGEASARYVRPGLFGRTWDFRLSARFRDVLYPGFHLREVTAGPGVRNTLAPGLFFDLDTLFRAGWQVNFGAFDPAATQAFALPTSNSSRGGELDIGLVYDTRPDTIEALSGQYLAARLAVSPPGIATHQYVQVLPEARLMIPLKPDFSALAFRVSGGWVLFKGDEGVPLGPRLFGGGAFGMRGYSRQRLSPEAVACDGTACRTIPVGGLSLFEASIEARLLPPQKQLGFIVFNDFGGAGARANPFESGLSAAVGIGARARSWFVPIALDFAYRYLDAGKFEAPTSIDPLLVFLRIGEAF
jgi:translocation and assembly module TamA